MTLRDALRRGPLTWWLAALAGALQAASSGWPDSPGSTAIDAPTLAQWAWVLQGLGVGLWALLLNAHGPAGPGRTPRPSPRRAAALGWVMGTTWLVGATWWLFISMHRYGAMPAWLAGLAVVALSAALSLYLAGAGYVYARWHHIGPPLAALPGDSRWRAWRLRWRGAGINAALFAATWLLAELARALIFTGFPWAASGYAHLHGPLRPLAPWIGVYGIGAVSATCAALVVAILQRPGLRAVSRLAALAGLAAVIGAGGWLARHDFTRPGSELAVSLLQGNVPQDLKFDPDALPVALNWYVGHLLNTPADVAIAPETALPLLPEQLPDGFWASLTAKVQAGRTAVLTGMPQGSFETGYSNSIVGLRPGEAASSAYRYDKHHLVPFGEFIPTGFRWFVRMMNMPLGDFMAGPLDAPSFEVRNARGEPLRLAPMVCYEDLFGEELGRRFHHAERAPDLLVNVSNLGWFDDASAIPQHLRISQLRTLELQRPMVRATNTGATVIIDHEGVVQQALPIRTEGVLNGLVTGRTGTTPYAWWTARAGLWPLILLALAIVAPCIVARTVPRD